MCLRNTLLRPMDEVPNDLHAMPLAIAAPTWAQLWANRLARSQKDALSVLMVYGRRVPSQLSFKGLQRYGAAEAQKMCSHLAIRSHGACCKSKTKNCIRLTVVVPLVTNFHCRAAFLFHFFASSVDPELGCTTVKSRTSFLVPSDMLVVGHPLLCRS